MPLAATSSAKSTSAEMSASCRLVPIASRTWARSSDSPFAISRSDASSRSGARNSASCTRKNASSPFCARASSAELGRGLGPWMERERLVFPYDAHRLPVTLSHRFELGLHPRAKRTLKIAEFDDGHQRRLVTARRRSPHGDRECRLGGARFGVGVAGVVTASCTGCVVPAAVEIAGAGADAAGEATALTAGTGRLHAPATTINANIPSIATRHLTVPLMGHHPRSILSDCNTASADLRGTSGSAHCRCAARSFEAGSAPLQKSGASWRDRVQNRTEL